MTTHPLVAEMRAIRKRKGMTARQLADQIGVSANAIGTWERGLCSAPADRLDAALRVLGMRLAVLPANEDTWVIAVEVGAFGRPQLARLVPGTGRDTIAEAAALTDSDRRPAPKETS